MNKKLFLILLLLFFIGCISTEMRVKIYHNGYARFRIKYSSMYDYLASSLAISLKEQGYNIIDRGYSNGEYFVIGETYGKISSDIFSISKSDSRVKNISSEISGGKEAGLFYDYYVYNNLITRNESQNSENNNYSMAIFQTMPLKVIISLPGEILDTNGVKSGKGSVVFNLTMADLYSHDIRLYVKSREGKLASSFDAQARANVVIEKNEFKIGKLKNKLNKINEQLEKQQQINNNLDKLKTKSDILLVDALNILVDYHFAIYNSYPQKIEDLKPLVSKIGYDDIPEPFSGELIFDVNDYTVKLIPK